MRPPPPPLTPPPPPPPPHILRLTLELGIAVGDSDSVLQIDATSTVYRPASGWDGPGDAVQPGA